MCVKQTLSILLISAVLAQSATKLIIFSNYIINVKSITLNFCENKNKPKMKCNGKCHLKKQLQEQDKKEGSSKNNYKEVNESQLCQDLFNENFSFLTNDIFIPNWHYLDFETNSPFVPIFHPPTC
jgi:hypothetical protein